MTMLTDYILGAFALYYGIILFSHVDKNKNRFFWSLAFISLSLSALIGGTYHGFSHLLDEFSKAILWKTTLGLTSIVSLLLLIASVKSTVSAKIQKLIISFGVIKIFIIFPIVIFSNQFKFVVLDYTFNMLVMVVLYISGSYKYEIKSNTKFIIIGIVISFIAAGIQISKFSIHQNFNNNDLYHLIQIVGLYFFYKGAKTLIDVKVNL